jgi:hypothetical protein
VPAVVQLPGAAQAVRGVPDATATSPSSRAHSRLSAPRRSGCQCQLVRMAIVVSPPDLPDLPVTPPAHCTAGIWTADAYPYAAAASCRSCRSCCNGLTHIGSRGNRASRFLAACYIALTTLHHSYRSGARKPPVYSRGLKGPGQRASSARRRAVASELHNASGLVVGLGVPLPVHTPIHSPRAGPAGARQGATGTVGSGAAGGWAVSGGPGRGHALRTREALIPNAQATAGKPIRLPWMNPGQPQLHGVHHRTRARLWRTPTACCCPRSAVTSCERSSGWTGCSTT